MRRNDPIQALTFLNQGVRGAAVLLQTTGRWMVRGFSPYSHFFSWLAEEMILFTNPHVHVLEMHEVESLEAAEVRGAVV